MAPLEDGGDETRIEIQQEDEVEPAKIAPGPRQPSAKEEEEHRIDHALYRSWCKWCVMGRARGAQHRLGDGSTIPIIGIDYFFITKEGVKKKKKKKKKELIQLGYKSDGEIEDARQKGEILKCVLTRCYSSKCIFAHCVPCKGADEEQYVSNLVVDDILWLGHLKMILKADNEPAVQALLLQVLRKVRSTHQNGENVTKEQPAKYESQSNGGTEVGVMLVRGLFRTLKLCLEARIDHYIPAGHAIIPWLLEHTCMILNTRTRQDDGLTPWARVKGRAFNQKLIGYGEVVLYKLPTKGPSSDPDGNMGTRWKEGVFVGYSRSANVYNVLTEEGLATSRSLMRRPMANRWSKQRIMAIQATPWSIRERQDPRVRFQEQPAPPEPTAAAAPPNPRRFRLNKKDLEEHGYTEGCVMCDHVQRYGVAKPGGIHTDACRTRLITEIGKTDAGQARLSSWSERVNRAIAEQIEHADKRTRASDARQPTNQEGGTEDGQPNEGTTTTTTAAGTGTASDVEMTARLRATARAQREAYEARTEDLRGGAPGYDEPEPATRSGGTGGDVAMDTSGNDGDVESTSGDADMGFLGSLEPRPSDIVSEMMLMQLGSTGNAYKRETRRALKQLVSEIYSPPRITAELRRRRRRWLLPGFALDLTVMDPEDGMPWDFSRPEKREKARRLRKEQKPFLLIGSPECRAFCTWQKLNEARCDDAARMRRLRVEAQVHIDFVASLYLEQLQDDLYFLHEHPRWASSWKLPSIEELMKIEGEATAPRLLWHPGGGRGGSNRQHALRQGAGLLGQMHRRYHGASPQGRVGHRRAHEGVGLLHQEGRVGEGPER